MSTQTLRKLCFVIIVYEAVTFLCHSSAMRNEHSKFRCFKTKICFVIRQQENGLNTVHYSAMSVIN